MLQTEGKTKNETDKDKERNVDAEDLAPRNVLAFESDQEPHIQQSHGFSSNSQVSQRGSRVMMTVVPTEAVVLLHELPACVNNGRVPCSLPSGAACRESYVH